MDPIYGLNITLSLFLVNNLFCIVIQLYVIIFINIINFYFYYFKSYVNEKI